MKRRFFYAIDRAPVGLEKRTASSGSLHVDYELACSRASGRYIITATQVGKAPVHVALRVSGAQAAAIFDLVVAHAVAPCHLLDVMADLEVL